MTLILLYFPLISHLFALMLSSFHLLFEQVVMLNLWKMAQTLCVCISSTQCCEKPVFILSLSDACHFSHTHTAHACTIPRHTTHTCLHSKTVRHALLIQTVLLRCEPPVKTSPDTVVYRETSHSIFIKHQPSHGSNRLSAPQALSHHATFTLLH